MKPNLAKELRAHIESPDIELLPGVYDGLSLRLVEKMGFSAATITGSGLSESNLGWEDVGLMGYEENLRATRSIAAVSNIPLLADADTGYGNAINCYFVTRGFEDAGVAGIMIEDQVWPKRCGHLEGKEVIDSEEMVEKVVAACEGRRDDAFIIKARTDSYATHGIKEVIRRLNLYAEAGADLLFADALLKQEDIETVVRNVSKPLQVNMGFGIRKRPTTPLLSAKQLEDMGVAVVSYPRLLTACALQGMKNGLSVLQQSLKEEKVIEREDLLFSMQELCDLMGLDHIKSMEKKFFAQGRFESKYRSKTS